MEIICSLCVADDGIEQWTDLVQLILPTISTWRGLCVVIQM